MKFQIRLVIYTLTAILLNASSGAAKTFDFTCGTIEFTVDFEESTVSDTIDGTASVDWQYDGDWVRWNVKDTDEFYGVNTKTGDLILDGVVNKAGCRMGDTSALASLPLSEGAYLRRAFIDLPEPKRMEIQSVLSQNGYYSSDIDGKWGRGTEAAIKTYVSENQEEMPAADYTNLEGATNTLFGAMSHMGLYTCANEECADEGSNESAIAGNEEVVDELFPTDVAELSRQINSCRAPGLYPQDRFSVIFALRRVNKEIGEWRIETFEESNDLGFGGNQKLDLVQQTIETCFSQWLPMGVMGDREYQKFSLRSDGAFSLVPITTKAELEREKVAIANRIESQLREAELKLLEEQEEQRRVDEARIAEDKAIENRRAAELAEQKRVRAEELAARQKAVETAARERAAATPSKLEELKQKCFSGVTVSGLCWALNHDEMRLVLIGRGYTCGDGSGGGFTNMAVGLASLFYGMAGEKMSMCEKSDAWVMIEPENLTFSCDVFNTCSYNVRDLGRLLIDEGFARSLEPSVQVVEGVALTSYCGRGNDGTEICAINRYDMVGQERNVVSLRKGTAGGEAPSFD
jgi:hypothetical protein